MYHNTYRPFSAAFLLFLPMLFFTGCNTFPAAGFKIQSANDLPAGTTITLSLPNDLECCEGKVVKPVGEEKERPLQLGIDRQAVFLLEAPLAANTSRKYEIVKSSSAGTVSGPTMKKTATGLEAAQEDHPLFTYHTATISPPEGAPDYYERSGFIHPFYSPAGKVLTDGFPVGHTHQHGIFFAWVNTTYRGDFTDFWNQQKETGTVAFRDLETSISGPVLAGFKSKHEYLSLKHGPVVAEDWTVQTYRIPQYNIIDLTARQQIIGMDTLFLNKYHYGGMGIRLAAEWNEVDSSRYSGPMQVITSEGITNRDSANHTRPNWTAVYGEIDGDTAGVALFDHPSNFRFPQPVRVHPSMPYFVLTPMVESAFELVPGQEYVSTYRIVSFDGKPNIDDLNAMWQAYASNIEVQWAHAKR